ncbi:AhpC/TSA family protein [Brevibacillus sp. M2.1A]|uniref:peroxiredoxin-like family protein n=1 Tax=Brevibacillus sp. M2.1A TaxID=2738980 RepID=UPI00156BD93D|nr:peroxiredoxin-like family protein [Brevibacillus sp. M2.1A]MCC8438539.1 AhpC/TSA family protein [Brevibacillus sp. M2.1A]
MAIRSLNQEFEKLAFNFKKNTDQHIRELQEKGTAKGLKVGSIAKDFVLKDTLGKDISLYEELVRGPVILTFYRGSWCPFCNRQLKAYQEILPKIQSIGAQLIAISPQVPDHSLSMEEKEGLSFKIVSDPKGIVAAKYNVLYEVPEYIKELYLQANIDLKEYNGTDHWILPVPATFMIDESGIVRFAHSDPDYTKRLEPADLIWGLQSL